MGGDGALWLGTSGGLARYHQGRWQVFKAQNSGLPSNDVQALAVGGDGALWAGTRGGLARYHQGRWQVFKAADIGLDDGSIHALAVGGDGALWAGTRGGVARYHQGRWQVFKAADIGLDDGSIHALAVGGDGALWAGTRGGLARYHQGRWQVFKAADIGLGANSIHALAVGGDGVLWAGTGHILGSPHGHGDVVRYHQGQWQVLDSSRSGLPDGNVQALAVGGDGALWVGVGDYRTGNGGLARYYRNQWSVFKTSNSGLPSNDVQALAVGGDGALWAGTRDGLARYHQGRWQVFKAADIGLPDDYVQALAVGGDGALWVGTFDGLARYHQGRWQAFKAQDSGLPDDNIDALAVGGDGALWVGVGDYRTGNGGLARYYRNQWSVFKTSNSGLPSNDVQALAVGGDGALWVGTFDGLARYHQGRWQAFKAQDSGLPDDNINALAVGGDGALWAGMYHAGLAHYSKGQWQDFKTSNSGLPSNEVQALAVGGDGALWLGTSGGLARYHEGRWQVFKAQDSGLPHNYVQALAVGGDGTLWVGTYFGLARFSPPASRPTVTELIGQIETVTQPEHLFSSSVFDPSYLTGSEQFRYQWTLKGPVSEQKTSRSSIYTTPKLREGKYVLNVVALDRYGWPSKPYTTEFTVDLRGPSLAEIWHALSPWAKGVLITLGVIGAYVGLCYLLLWRAPLTLLWVQDQIPFQDLVTKGIPEKYAFVAVLANLVIQLTGLPYFAKHAKTRREWCLRYQEGQKRLDDLKPPIREAYLQHTEILDAWAERNFEVAHRNFRAWPPYNERQTYVPLPVLKDGATVANLSPEHVRPVFERGQSTTFIGGEGGAGKTTLACQLALWGMEDDPADRLCPEHRMLPVLIGPGIGFDPLREASRLRDTIRGHLQRLVEATEAIPDDLFDKLLRQKRLLVILDGLSEMVEEPGSDATKEARPRNPAFAVAALIVASRQADKGLEPLDAVIEPMRLDTDHLLPFLNAYLAAAGKAHLTDAELYRACSRLADLVGAERGITPLLARLYAEQLIDKAREDGTVQELPETVPDLMLRYLNGLNRDRQGCDPDNPTVHRAAKVAAWACLKSTYRPGAASKQDLRDELAKLNTGRSPDDLLSYLEHRLRVIWTIEPAETQVQFSRPAGRVPRRLAGHRREPGKRCP